MKNADILRQCEEEAEAALRTHTEGPCVVESAIPVTTAVLIEEELKHTLRRVRARLFPGGHAPLIKMKFAAPTGQPTTDDIISAEPETDDAQPDGNRPRIDETIPEVSAMQSTTSDKAALVEQPQTVDEFLQTPKGKEVLAILKHRVDVFRKKMVLRRYEGLSPIPFPLQVKTTAAQPRWYQEIVERLLKPALNSENIPMVAVDLTLIE